MELKLVGILLAVVGSAEVDGNRCLRGGPEVVEKYGDQCIDGHYYLYTSCASAVHRFESCTLTCDPGIPTHSILWKIGSRSPVVVFKNRCRHVAQFPDRYHTDCSGTTYSINITDAWIQSDRFDWACMGVFGERKSNTVYLNVTVGDPYVLTSSCGSYVERGGSCLMKCETGSAETEIMWNIGIRRFAIVTKRSACVDLPWLPEYRTYCTPTAFYVYIEHATCGRDDLQWTCDSSLISQLSNKIKLNIYNC